MNGQYVTVRQRGKDEIIINRSRFIGCVCPCETEEEALSFLQEIRNSYHDASHHCYAYIVGTNSGIMRYSDDGEPGGTAGLPIMDVMRGRQIVNCCTVVVRYFGGILLGTGGLVRAYTQSSKTALEAAGIVRMEHTSHFLCDIPYSCWDSVRHAAESLPVHILTPDFAATVTFTLSVRSADASRVLDELSRITSRKIETIPAYESFEPWEL